jgi:ABC-type transporter Mla maintaining outer membrane lipid asymmetry ATPase subunit MlaF
MTAAAVAHAAAAVPAAVAADAAEATEATSDEFVAVERIVKTYGRQRVLDEVSLVLGSDEFVCLLGPSGCGKTTLLRILCGIEDADAGRIRLLGSDIAALPAAASSSSRMRCFRT